MVGRPIHAFLFQPFLLLVVGLAFTGATGSSETPEKVQTRISIKAQPFDLSQVRLLDGPFIDAMERDRKWPEKGIKVRQETRFPEQQGTALAVAAVKTVELSMNFRIPGWAARGGKVRLNGKQLDSFSSPGSYFVLRRIWKDGDRIEIDLPMDLHLERTPDDPNLAAIRTAGRGRSVGENLLPVPPKRNERAIAWTQATADLQQF